MRQPFVLIVLAYLSGIIAVIKIPLNTTAWFLISAIGISILLMLWLFKPKMKIVILVVLCVCFSFSYVSWLDETRESQVSQYLSSTEEHVMLENIDAKIKGVVVTKPQLDGDLFRFTLKTSHFQLNDEWKVTNGEKIIVSVYLQDESELKLTEQVKQGVTIETEASLSLPSPARNPGAFDYAKFLSYKRISWLGEVNGINRLSMSKPKHINFYYSTGIIRDYLDDRIKTIFPENVAGLMSASLIGIDDEIDLELEEDFTRLGLIHIIAISGLNVGLVVAIVYWTLSRIGLTRERTILITAIFIPLFVIVTGAASPVMRAGIMVLVALYALYRYKSINSLNLLSFTAFIMLLFEPLLLFQLSFQLSFIMTLGLLLWVNKLNTIMEGIKFVWLRTLLSVTIVAQLVSFPLMIYYFNHFSFLSALSNLIVVPLFSVIIIPIGYMTLVLDFIHPALSALPALMINGTFQLFSLIVDTFSSLKTFHHIWASPSILWIISYTIILSLMLELSIRHEKSRLVKMALLGLFLLCVIVAYFPLSFERDLQITYLDVGQGDSIFIEFPSREAMLIDAGGIVSFVKDEWRKRRDPYDVGKDVVVPFLMHKGIRTIDTVVMTHGDYDHVGGMASVFESINVKRVIGTPISQDKSLERTLHQKIIDDGIPYYVPSFGHTEQPSNDVLLTFLNTGVEANKENNQSIVFLLQYKNKSFLFTGDIEEEIEHKLVNQWQFPAIDVMKIAHHGSKTSTSDKWIDSTMPSVAVISAGTNNRFGHPVPDVVKRLKESGATIFRTDRQGAITFSIDQAGEIRVSTMIEDNNKLK